jgi:hypothetical protein
MNRTIAQTSTKIISAVTSHHVGGGQSEAYLVADIDAIDGAQMACRMYTALAEAEADYASRA